jgi:hypothetical protein
VLERDNKRLKTRLRFAGLRQIAAPEDVDYRARIAASTALCSSAWRAESGSRSAIGW